jgi:hypothetical protein
MFVGQKIRLWKFHAQTLQLLVEQQYMLTVTARISETHFTGTLEDGSVYSFDNGYWWAVSDQGQIKLEIAVHVWNVVMSKPEGNMRIILLPEGENIVPDGDVEKCKKHNRYHYSRGSCIRCRVASRTLLRT